MLLLTLRIQPLLASSNTILDIEFASDIRLLRNSLYGWRYADPCQVFLRRRAIKHPLREEMLMLRQHLRGMLEPNRARAR